MPKGLLPLPRINQLVDSASEQLFNFMGAFSGFNKIKMAKGDEAKTLFIIEQGMYCYKLMLFWLKNTEATYQCLVNRIFKSPKSKKYRGLCQWHARRGCKPGRKTYMPRYLDYVDGSSCEIGRGAGIIHGSDGEIPWHALHFQLKASNNQLNTKICLLGSNWLTT